MARRGKTSAAILLFCHLKSLVARECTLSSCSELAAAASPSNSGWDATVGHDPTVCGESDNTLGGCSGANNNFSMATAFCEAPGARLCSWRELMDNEAEGSGCTFDTQLVWAADACPHVSGQPAHLVGYGANVSAAGVSVKRCEVDSGDFRVRCCATVVACTMSPTVEPTALPAPIPTSLPVPYPTQGPSLLPSPRPVPTPTLSEAPTLSRAPTHSPPPTIEGPSDNGGGGGGDNSGGGGSSSSGGPGTGVLAGTGGGLLFLVGVGCAWRARRWRSNGAKEVSEVG